MDGGGAVTQGVKSKKICYLKDGKNYNNENMS